MQKSSVRLKASSGPPSNGSPSTTHVSRAPRPSLPDVAATAEPPKAPSARLRSLPTATPRRPRARGRTDKRDDKLTLILTTAAELFAEHGYESTTLDAIGEQLGMHKATLYHYVRGKEEILYLCQSRSFGDLEEVYEQVRDSSRPVSERLRLFVLHLAQAQNSVFGRCLLRVGPKPLAEAAGGEIRRIQRRLDTIVRDLLKEGMATGELRQVDPALCGAMLYGALNWVPRWFKPEGRLTLDTIAATYVDIFINGLRANGAQGSPGNKRAVVSRTSTPPPARANRRSRAR